MCKTHKQVRPIQQHKEVGSGVSLRQTRQRMLRVEVLVEEPQRLQAGPDPAVLAVVSLRRRHREAEALYPSEARVGSSAGTNDQITIGNYYFCKRH
tara:strand:- start:125 stop:412 length:288 start_codon:yes stop_codon:yes gene_type:complete